MIRIDISGARAYVRFCDTLTVGMVGATAEFHFDDAWNGLYKTAVFRQGDVTRDVTGIDSEVTIPHEVFAVPGIPVYIGVYGTNADGTTVIPTVWVKTANVKPGADPSGDESTEPSLPVWAQLGAEISALKETVPTKITAPDTASVGQMIIVKAVDENGRPTEWEAVDRTHWAEGGMVEILPETALTADDEGMMLVTDEVSLTLGDTYVVVWNGTEYECVAQEFVDGDVTLTALGDVSVVSGGASTGEPFAIVRYPDEMIEEIGGIYLVILAVDGSATATLSIIHDAEKVRKLDNKYLDLDWLPIRKEVQLAAEKTVTSAVGTPTETTGGFPDLDNSMVYDGMPLVVYWDGVRYEVTVRYYNYNTDEGGNVEEYWLAGAANGDDVPFTLTFGSGSYVGDVYHTGRTNVSCDDDEQHVASVWGLGPNKLPSEYLPDGVIPTKVSELENDAGYLTEHQSLDGLATETYVDDAIANIDIPAGSVVVTVTQNDDNTYSADMTYEEIVSALDSGTNVVAVRGNFVYTLTYRDSSVVRFESAPYSSGYVYGVTVQNGNSNVIYTITSRFLGNALTINGTAYDGSKPVTLEISSGGVGYELEQLVMHTVTEEEAESAMYMSFDLAKNYREYVILYYATPGVTTINGKIAFNSTASPWSTGTPVVGNIVGYTSGYHNATLRFAVNDDGVIIPISGYQCQNDGASSDVGSANPVWLQSRMTTTANAAPNLYTLPQKRTSIAIGTYQTGWFGAGSIFAVYGIGGYNFVEEGA